MKIQEIETPRLLLRGFTKEDAWFAFGIWNDPEMGEYLPDPTDIDEEKKKELLKMYETLGDDEECCYLISEDKHTHERIGTCSFIIDENGVYDIAYCVHESKWGNGYATEMAKGLADYAKMQGASKMTIWVTKGNAASAQIAKKLGGIVVKENTFIKRGTNTQYTDEMYEIML